MGLSRSAGYSQSGARGHSPGSELGDGQYAVVHLVSQESHKELIGPQVIDHMRSQRDTPGKWRPAVVVVGLLEPARIALRGGFRARMRALQRRAGSVRVVSLPYVSRLALTLNAIFLGWRIRGLTRHLPVVFHCRGESSFAWAEAIAPRFQSAAIVADVRGSWPEDLVYARGFNSLEEADPVTKATYAYHTQRVRDTLETVAWSAHRLSRAAGVCNRAWCTHTLAGIRTVLCGAADLFCFQSCEDATGTWH